MTLKEKLTDWKRKHFGYVKINGKYSTMKEAARVIDECKKDEGKIHCVYERKGVKHEYDIN